MRSDRHIQEARERIAYEEGEAADREWLEKSQRTSRWMMVWGFALAIACLAGLFFAGCAHVDKTPANNPVVVLDEPADGCVAKAIAKAPVSAITLPWMPIIVFDGKPDQCRLEHEDEHKRQQKGMGEAAWTLDYGQQWAGCTGRAIKDGRMAREPSVSINACYLSNTWEAMAFAVQDACAERLARASP